MVGNATNHAVSDIKIEDFTINGKLARPLGDLGVLSNQFVRNNYNLQLVSLRLDRIFCICTDGATLVY